MRSWAWTVLGTGGTVGSSREATSHVGVAICLQLGVGEQRWATRRKGLTTPQIGTAAANRSR